MQQMIEQLAQDAGITTEKAAYVFKAFTGQLVCRVPALKQVIDAVFKNEEDAVMKVHINKLIQNLQHQQGKEIFGNWIMPQEQAIIHREEGKKLF